MDDVATVDPVQSRIEHRAAVIAYEEARDALAGACAALVWAADRTGRARDALWEEARGLHARGGDPGPMPLLLAETEEGRRLLRDVRSRLRGLL